MEESFRGGQDPHRVVAPRITYNFIKTPSVASKHQVVLPKLLGSQTVLRTGSINIYYCHGLLL